MSMMATFLMLTGAIFWLSLILLVLSESIKPEIIFRDDIVIFKIFGFGFIKAKGEKIKKNLNVLRKTKDKSFFLEAPEWFNKRVYNLGIKR